jgi:hypothetical protein
MTKKFLANVAPYYDDPITGHSESGDEVIAGIVAKYGAEKVIVNNDAFDVNGNLIPKFRAVYLREGVQ